MVQFWTRVSVRGILAGRGILTGKYTGTDVEFGNGYKSTQSEVYDAAAPDYRMHAAGVPCLIHRLSITLSGVTPHATLARSRRNHTP